jgi:hypothetical protein
MLLKSWSFWAFWAFWGILGHFWPIFAQNGQLESHIVSPNANECASKKILV